MTELEEIKSFYRAVQPDCTEFCKTTAPLNEFWGGVNQRQSRDIFNNASTLEEVVQAAQRTYMFSINPPSSPPVHHAVKWTLHERHVHLVGCDTLLGIEESPYSAPETVVEMYGKRYTPDLLRCVNIAQSLLSAIRWAQDLRVVELGGGLGHLARVLHLSKYVKQHIIIDLPETLVFSYAFLRKNFPDVKIELATSGTYMIGDDAAFVFVPVAYADCILDERSVDLFINTASMGEMRNETIRYWMSFVQQKLNPDYLFTLNRFLNTLGPGLTWRLMENECQQHYDNRWSVLRWQLEPWYLRCPYVDTLASRCVEILARRTGGAVGLSEGFVEGLEAEDWWRLRHEGHVMGMRDNPICVNGGESGTLFKLWERLRLAPSVTAVDMMVTYLQKLNRDPTHPFEELDYYARLGNSLALQGR